MFPECPTFWQNHHHLRATIPSKSEEEKVVLYEPVLQEFFFKASRHAVKK